MTRTPRLLLLLATAITFAVALPSGGSAQLLPHPLPVPPGILEGGSPGDSLALQETQADTINPEDTLPAVQLPALSRTLPEGWHTGVWEWDRDEILGSKAITLAELLEEVPGSVPVRGGDFGTPAVVSAFGAGGGRIRVFRDGIEVLPVEGSVTDLSRLGLAGLRSVRVVRSMNDFVVELESVLAEGGQPYSLVEAGTGDLNSNLFRWTFSHPRALGGVLALAMDRVDTRGPRGEEPGVSQGAWIRYARSLTQRGGLVVDWGTRSSERESLYSPGKASRSDWSVRTRWSLLPGLVGDLHYASSLAETEDPDTFPFHPQSRTQLGAILSYDSPWIRASGRYRKISGTGLPNSAAEVSAEGRLGRFGGVAGDFSWADWEKESVSRTRFRAWSAPVWGFSLFAETGSGSWGLPYLPPVVPVPEVPEGEEGEEPPAEPEEPEPFPAAIPGPRFSDHSGSRYGARFDWRGFSLSGALLEMEADSLFILGLDSDRTGTTQEGGSRTGFEVAARIPLYPRGFALEGWWQKWDQAEDPYTTPADAPGDPELVGEEEMPWRYLPTQSYRASLSFHDTFKPTGNLEVWFDLGVRGRDPMAVPFFEEVDVGEGVRSVPAMVPFYQSWFVRLQIRIVTVRAFVMWENFTVRQRNQDLPGRILPATRSLYGVRWTLWN